MLIGAVILFLLAATLGLSILTAILQDRLVNHFSLMLHGSVAAAAIGLMLCYIIITGASSLLLVSLILFIFAALGGLILFVLAKKRKRVPKWLIVIHPVVAVAGLITLIIYILP